MERFYFLCASKQWHCSVCCPPRTYVDDIERIDWKLLWNSKIFLFLLFWPSQVKYCFWIKDLGQKFWGIMITGDLFADAQCRDEFMNPSWLGVITLYHGVGRWCPTVTPWDTRGVLCPLGTQDVRNPNSPHAAQPRGHLRHTELCDITGRHCGVLVQPEKQPFVRWLPRIDIPGADEHVWSVAWCPLSGFPDIDVRRWHRLEWETVAGNSRGKKSTCVGIKHGGVKSGHEKIVILELRKHLE